VSVGTDPDLSLKTRRGTGYYKAPSLKGVWYRGPFEHNGSVLTLEDWFDPRRLRDGEHGQHRRDPALQASEEVGDSPRCARCERQQNRGHAEES